MLLWLPAACGRLESPPCATEPSFEYTARALAACLSPAPTPAEVEQVLMGWRRIDAEWGGVSQADLLPSGGLEFVVRYHADLQTVRWNPQGNLVVLRRDGRGWRVAFDASSLEVIRADGTVWSNWSYRVLQATDATGDGLDDLLVELQCSNGLRTVLSYLAVLTAGAAPPPAELGVAYLEETTLTAPTARFVEHDHQKVLQESLAVGYSSHPAITRTYTFDGRAFRLAKETIDPAAATARATTPDGALWVGFDTFDGGGGSPLYSRLLGLYRLKDGELTHSEIPGTIRVLRAAPDGNLVVGAGCGVMRFDGAAWETLAPVDCQQSGFSGPLFPTDLAIAEGGDIWVGGAHWLARWDGTAWTEYDVRARRLLLGPDGSVWTEGWDGRPAGDCCFTHVTGSTWVTFTHSADLPVPLDLLRKIRDLGR